MGHLAGSLTTVLFTCTVLAPAQGHPHFDDGGTLVWHTKLAAAMAAAKAADRVILVEFGRQA